RIRGVIGTWLSPGGDYSWWGGEDRVIGSSVFSEIPSESEGSISSKTQRRLDARIPVMIWISRSARDFRKKTISHPIARPPPVSSVPPCLRGGFSALLETDLEDIAEARGHGSRLQEVGTAEGGEEVVQRDLVRQINDGYGSHELSRSLGVEQVVAT